MRTCEPSGFTFNRMLPNCSGVFSSVASVMVACSTWPGTDGVPPSEPPATCTFCACKAVCTSTGVRPKLVSLLASSQIRIAYCEPNSVTVPTPSIRLTGSSTFDAT